jgi:hypothetical protein
VRRGFSLSFAVAPAAFARVGRHLTALVKEDRSATLVALGFALTQLVTVAWDLPGSHGWENDGLAPRDLFAGIAHNLTPGQGHQYPLLHCLLLALLCLPVLLPAALAGSLDAASVRERVLSVPTMTGVSLIAKLVAIAMACASLLVLARIVRRTVSARAGWLAALFGATCLSFAFYGRVSNLEVPYLTYTLFALDAVLDSREHGDAGSLRRFALLAAAAVATKDQAYAAFVLVAPLYLLLLPLTSSGVSRRHHLAMLARAAGLGAIAYAFMSGALLNPTGLAARFRLLSGPASQGWQGYTRDFTGVAANVRDALAAEPHAYWPFPALAVAWLGVGVALVRPSGTGTMQRRSARLLPLVAGVSSFVFFTLVVARAEHRFLLPFGLMLAAYGGTGADFLLTLAAKLPVARALVPVTGAVLAASFAFAAWKSFAVHLTQLGDARRSVTAFLAQAPRGTVVETYGLTVYAPHFDVGPDAPYRVRRVGPTSPSSRNPLVGVEELTGNIGDVAARKPDVIVLSEGFANAYLVEKRSGGRALSSVLEERRADAGTVRLVASAARNLVPGYRVALVARPELPSFATALGLAPVAIQSTTGLTYWVLLRTGTPADRALVESDLGSLR